MRSHLKSVRVFIFATAIALGTGVQAVTPQPFDGGMSAFDLQITRETANAGAPLLEDSISDASLLRDAFELLDRAEHDYKGRREKAMKAIEAAGKELGIKLKSDGKKRAIQGDSDEHLREARGLLEKARTRFENGGSQRALKHVDLAITLINEALRIR